MNRFYVLVYFLVHLEQLYFPYIKFDLHNIDNKYKIIYNDIGLFNILIQVYINEEDNRMGITLNTALKSWFHENREELSRHKMPAITTYSVLAMPELEHTRLVWGLMNGQTREVITEPRFTHVATLLTAWLPAKLVKRLDM